MATIPYTVRAGDTLVKIARAHGVATWQEIYRHPDNAAFRAKRPNPDRIFPGDVLRVPGGADPGVIIPVRADTGDIEVTQVLPPGQTGSRRFSQNVVQPVSLTLPSDKSPLAFIDVAASIQRFRFEVRKGSARFWVGAAVPDGTADFARAQVFFHPTPSQAGVHDRDYPTFTGGWKSVDRYVWMQGQQLAAAGRLLPLIVPFMTMKSLALVPGANLFAERPDDTLSAILEAVRAAAGTPGPTPIQVAAVGATSFSSGIAYLGRFIRQLGSSGLLREAFDLDGSFANVPERTLENAGSARYVRFGQLLASGTPNRISLPPPRWTAHAPPRDQSRIHGYIGFECYYSAMVMSHLRPQQGTA